MIGKPKPARHEKKRAKKKKTSRQIVEKNLDALVREIVLARDSACVCPSPEKGHSDVRQCGHLFTRSKKSTRWSLLNCHCQCSSCNLLHEFDSHRYTFWFIHRFGLCQYEKLYKIAETPSLLKTHELEELFEQLSAIRDRQRREPEWLPYFTQQEILSGKWKYQEPVVAIVVDSAQTFCNCKVFIPNLDEFILKCFVCGKEPPIKG